MRLHACGYPVLGTIYRPFGTGYILYGSSTDLLVGEGWNGRANVQNDRSPLVETIHGLEHARVVVMRRVHCNLIVTVPVPGPVLVYTLGNPGQ